MLVTRLGFTERETVSTRTWTLKRGGPITVGVRLDSRRPSAFYLDIV